MPSKTDFNVSPYYDDFAESKKFHRVMYRPAFAIQARELTTQQSITQNQIEKMSDSMFKHGAMVVAGEANYDLNYYAVKLTSFTGTLSDYAEFNLTGSTSGIVADVLAVVATDGTDPDTLFVKYRNSGTDKVTTKFTEGEIITSGHADGMTAVVSSCATGSRATVDAGTYYINGFFVDVDTQVITLDKYTNTPSYRVGLTIVENFITSTDDTTLLDNATGASNENATGAHRFKIDLTLTKLALTSTADASFVELFRIKDGFLQDRPISDIKTSFEDTLARRTFDESGNYSVRDFELDVREHLLDGDNRGINAAGLTSRDGNVADESKLAFGFSQGKAYVKGYEIGKIGTTYVDVNKARTFETDSGIITRFNVGSFVNVESVFGIPDINFVSGEIENYKSLRLVDTAHVTRGTVFGTALGYVYDIGRAKTRAFEFNSGSVASPDSGTSNHQASASVNETKFKHFLFDVEMFAHINVKGPMSGALTTGDTLTGSTSGSTGTIESISTAATATITGITSESPAIVTCSGGHTFTEGQRVKVSSVVGMTDINGFVVVKNPTATTFEAYTDAASPSASSQLTQTYVSGGTLEHTVIILNNVQGEFVDGETITAPTNSRTGTVQVSAFGCKGFEQKQFHQTKGISMPGSPNYTSNVSLDSVFGDNTQLTGLISTGNEVLSGSIALNGTDGSSTDAGDNIVIETGTSGNVGDAIGLESLPSDTVLGKGTRFTTQLKIGDQITFRDNADDVSTRIIDSIISDTQLETTIGLGSTNATTVTFERQRAKLQDAGNNLAVKKLPYDIIKTLLTTDNGAVSDTSFKIRRQFVATLSSAGTATFTAGTNEVFTSFSSVDYSVSIMTTGSGGTGAVGDVIDLSTSGDFTLGGSPTGKTLAINLGSGYNGHKVKVIATISASVVSAKTKTSNTGATTVIATEALATANTISLGKADVTNIQSIFMAADFSTTPTINDTEVTDRFKLDTGQRDNFYDIGRLVIRPGKVAPTGQLLVTFDFFEHGAGNFFCVDSYSDILYKDIGGYTSDVTGEAFPLRDCLDFRPRVDDASTINSGDVDRSFDGTGFSSIEIVKINTDITNDMEYYLSQRARVYMTATGKFKVISGAPAIEPSFGETLEDAMHLYDVFIPAFTFDVSTVEITPIDNRRYTMRDIGNLHKRIENVEFYTQLSLLESNAQNLQIQDADGFDRFKNGIIVDNFTGHGIGEVSDDNYSVAMDMANGEVRAAHHMDNINLIEADSSLGSSTTMTDSIRTANGYQKTGDLITLPYSEETVISQQFASTSVNLNPYDTISYVGVMTLSPDQDEWMETETLPEMVVNIPGPFDTLLNGAAGPVRELNLGTVWNEWNDNWSSRDIAGTEQKVGMEIERRPNWNGGPGEANGLIRKVTTSTVSTQEINNRTRQGIRTSLVPGGLRTQSMGNRVVQVAFATFIRHKHITFTAQGMKPNTIVYPFFDGIDVTRSTKKDNGVIGGGLDTDAAGKISGVFIIPSQRNVVPIYKFRTGKRAFRLTSSSTNDLTDGLVFTSAEADYTAKGMIQTVQGTSVSTREVNVQRTTASDTSQIVGATGTRIIRDEAGPWYDPICQSFLVDQEDGYYITSVDLFFKTKSTTLPATVQIRTMVNGYPTTEILPFAQISVAPGNINTSDDASVVTTFTFPSPVYVANNTEYAICAIASSDEFNIFTAKMGQTTIDGARLISQQPYLGSMFKSQNSSTWTAEQNEDVKFNIKRAKYTTDTVGKIYLVNDDFNSESGDDGTTTASNTPLILRKNPLTTTTSSADITVHHRNHGMHSTSNNVTIAGVPSGTYNGIASTNINGTYTSIKNIKMDSYQITAANSDTATVTGDIGGTVVTATRNILFDIIKPIAGIIVPPSTSITSTLRTTTGRTLEGTESEFSFSTASKQKTVDLNADFYLTSPAIVASELNETNEMSGSKSLNLTLSINSPSDHISPVIDTARLSAHLIRNRIYNPVSGTTPDFVADTANTGGSGPAQYITRPILLENAATSFDVRLSAIVPSTGSVEMYFRLSNADDARKLTDLVWTPFNGDGTPDKAVPPSDDDRTFREHQYSADGLGDFTAFQLKIIMKSTTSCYPPRVKDMRGIALAV